MEISSVPRVLFKFFSSYGFAVVIMTLLLVLTFFGTLEQIEYGLYDVQHKYFNSPFLVHWMFGIVPIPMPGGYLLMGLLTINLTCGALIKARKDWRRPGMLIAHSGILLLILGGFVTYHYSIDGHMTLFEGEISDEVVSYYEWELLITELENERPSSQWVIPGEKFTGMRDAGVTLTSSELPFDLKIEGFMRNSVPRPTSGTNHSVGNVELVPLPTEIEAERNIAGMYATVEDTTSGGTQAGVLWGYHIATWLPASEDGRFRAIPPWRIQAGERDFTIQLQHKRWKVPFSIVLDKFTRDLHPRTQMAANFQSSVTKIENGNHRQIEIKMNEPLRHRGYTFFQASWGPEGAGPNEPLFSTFAVVMNPADQWPKYACYVIAFGLIIHFLQKLTTYLKREQRRTSA